MHEGVVMEGRVDGCELWQIEGWVYINYDEGGTLLSVSAKPGSTGSIALL